MRYFFLILIGSGIVLQSLSKIIILVGFQINREYISKNICVQKSKQNNHCKGSCHLKKQLENEDKKQRPVNNKNNSNDFQIISQTFATYNFDRNYFAEKPVSPFIVRETQTVPSSIFHPPPAEI
jgi:hypothetical protein